MDLYLNFELPSLLLLAQVEEGPGPLFYYFLIFT